MAEGLPPLVVELRAKATELFSTLKDVQSETKKMVDENGRETERAATGWEKMQGAGKAAAIGLSGAAVTFGTIAVKMGMDFQESMTSLVTGAGESEENIKEVSNGILDMAGKVGVSADDLSKGMYLIESAGYHGAEGLDVLKAAAEGARVGNADMKVVADGVTTALTDYGLKASDAAGVTSKLVATVAQGKTTMGDLSGALATVLPIASSAKVGLDQILGAMATMTAKGTPAADAATYLKQTIAQLSNPTTKAATEMESLGLSAVDISSHLGERGLTGTLSILTDAIEKKMGPAGTVLIDNLKKTAKAGGDMQAAIDQLPPTQQTYVAALANMVGGTKSMQAALMLSGDSMGTFQKNVDAISKATPEAGGHVKGFAETQKDLKTQLDNARAGIEAVITKIGLQLIPVVTKVLQVGEKWGSWLAEHKAVLVTFAAIIGGVLLVAIYAWVAGMVMAAAATIAATWPILAIIAGLALLGVGISWLAEHWSTVWNGIKSVAQAVWDWLKQAGQWFVEHFIHPIVEQVQAVERIWKAVWNGIKGFFEGIVNFIKEHAAFIVGALMILFPPLGLLVVAIHWLADHWHQVWTAIGAVIGWVHDNVIVPIGNSIQTTVIHPIAAVVSWLGDVWHSIWNGMGTALSWVYNNILKPVGDFIVNYFINPIAAAINWLGQVWSSVWNAISSVAQWVWNNVIEPIVHFVEGAFDKIGGIIHGIGSAISSVGHFLGFADGGVVPGPKGAPRLAVVHGGEYVLSNDMLAGRQEPTGLDKAMGGSGTSLSAQALTGGAPQQVGGSGVGGAPVVNVFAQTNATPTAIASSVGWELRRLAS